MAITYDGQGLFEDGKPWLPVSGEYQYSRGDRRSWYKEIAKMKALGIDTVASYVIWIHHEEEEGVFDFSGNKSLREFVGEVAAAKMKIFSGLPGTAQREWGTAPNFVDISTFL